MDTKTEVDFKLQPGEKPFHVYQATLKFTHVLPASELRDHHKIVPGTHNNVREITQNTIAEWEPVSDDDIREYMVHWFRDANKRRFHDNEQGFKPWHSVRNMEVTKIEYYGLETWYLGWFSHLSLNPHLTDFQLIESFYAFCDRNLKYHRMLEEQHDPRGRTLMGAENQWRHKPPKRGPIGRGRIGAWIEH